MTFSEHHLGKSIETLDFDVDIEPFIRREIPEGQNMEYKSLGSPLWEHGDVISAYLNSGGGLLIIGTPIEVEITLPGGRKARVCRGPFTPLPAISKDDARRSLISKVSPLPAGVLVNPVPCVGGCVLVVDVSSSDYPPHQNDGTYWIRLDGETRRAPHALVESLFLQRRGPNLECRLEISDCRMADDRKPSDFKDRWDIRLKVVLINNSRNIAEHCAVDVKMDTLVTPLGNGLQPMDPQPGDFTLTIVTDEHRCSLQRYRLQREVLHAYEWKALEGDVRYSRSLDWRGPRTFPVAIDVQAKDMLRRRYEFVVDISMGQRGQVIEPTRILTIDSPP